MNHVRIELCLLSLITFVAEAAPSARPNVVIFVADDLGARDLGCYGSTFYETPQLDRLAQSGVRFSDGYAACPVCSPTRGSLLTGKWPQRLGITDYIGAPMRPDLWMRNTRLLPAPYADRLSLPETTLAEWLHGAGYATFFAGKWHLGPAGWWPEDQGFDVNRGGTDRGGPYGGKQYFSPYDNPRLTDGPPGEHLTDRLARETATFITEHRDRPFLAYLAFFDVHVPLMARPDLQLKYEQKRQRLHLTPRSGREEPRDVRLVQEHAVYAAMVEAMDQAVGTVVAKLDELGLRDNTLIVFTSDNGGLATAEGSPTSNLPLRAGKGWLYEGGIRVPLIVSWPAAARRGEIMSPGSVSRVPCSSPDLVPTVLEVTQVDAPGIRFDGKSLVPALGGKDPGERPLYWHYPHYGNQGGAPGAAIRRRDWKLIEWAEQDRIELFNLAQDLGEHANLAENEPDRLRVLLADLHDWQRQVGAKFPQPNPHFDPGKANGRE